MNVWNSKAWKDRRNELVSGASTCEWCKNPFEKKNPATIHHTKSRHRSEGSFKQYMEMALKEVIVICKKCHFIWTKYKIKRGDPIHTCKNCGGVKISKRFDLCFRCAGAEGKINPNPMIKVGPPESFFDGI